MKWRAFVDRRFDAWLRRRQGPDMAAITLHRGRIYILPTRLGLAFGAMLLAMLLGSLNYSNNLGLALTFGLGALALVAMHVCHGNLKGIVATRAGTEPPFAGHDARFRLTIHNPSRAPRIDLELSNHHCSAAPASIDGDGSVTLDLALPTSRRGRVRLARCEIATRYPFGLFRAWAVLHPDADCLVYPRPAEVAPERPRAPADGSGAHAGKGDDDFAGLKDYHPGDPPRHIAWKALARGGELLVKEFAGAAAVTPWFDLAATPGRDLETRLAVLARWIVDAAGAGLAFGLRLPGIEIEPQPGPAQRERCLAALAEFEAPPPP